uniref:Holliday junction resolvase n=1 Tax=Pithovirus LCPAC104 TaxID=2506589 RepID=A0A481Z427_9VIRU|nr:MAG: holliday junction resolvase [Pithovirus LCPAC104]
MLKMENQIVCHNPHKNFNNRDWSNEEVIRFISIDPGKINFAIRIEVRYRKDKFPPKMEIFIKKNFFNKNDNNDNNELYSRITDFLDTFIPFYEKTHFVLIERQFKKNYTMIRISQHIISYFLFKLKDLPLFPSILEIDSKFKYTFFNSSSSKKKGMKYAGVEKALELLKNNKDDDSLSIISNSKKKDDLADTVIQIEAMCKCFEI